MSTIALFHSVYGRREVETNAARRLRALGHEVHVPDLYAGRTAPTLETGFALMDSVGWETIAARAHDALEPLPDRTVLLGISMGAGVVRNVLPSRRATAGLLLLHGPAEIPDGVRPGLPVQLHIADPDTIASPRQVENWQVRARGRGAAVAVYTYPGVGHFYTDETLPDHDAAAADLTWRRAIEFLGTLDPS